MTHEVRISVASMRQRFHGCTADFIRDVCHSRCCDAPSRASGTLITIHPSEEAAIRARGGVVENGLLVTPNRVCTFKTSEFLCALHGTDDKPSLCVADPFTLNRRDCFLVRNRYRTFACFVGQAAKNGPAPDWPPAYVAFRGALDAVFGFDEAQRLADWLAAHGDGDEITTPFVPAWMPDRSYERLRTNAGIVRGHTRGHG